MSKKLSSSFQSASDTDLPSYEDMYKKLSATTEADIQPIATLLSQETAKDLYDNRDKNRQIKMPRANAYTKMMLLGDVEGGWRSAAIWENPIKVTKSGQLTAGQHRMYAFIKSGLPFMAFAVSFNASDEARLFQDKNINRSKVDELDMFYPDPGWSNIKKVTRVSTAGRLYALHNSTSWAERPDMKKKLSLETTAKVLELYTKDFEAYNDGIMGKLDREHIMHRAAVVTALVFAHSRMTPNKWSSVYESIRTGNYAPGTAPFKMEQVFLTQVSDTSESRWQQVMQCLACLKAHEENKVSQLTVDMASPFPISFDVSELNTFWKNRGDIDPIEV